MEFKDLTQLDNKLMHRTEVTAVLCFEGATPSNDKVKAALAKKAGVDEKLSIVKHIYTRFGEQCADVLLFAYESEEHYLKVERVKELPKAPEAEKPAEEAAPAPEAPKEEAAPAEPAPETPKEEEAAPAEEKSE